MVGVKSAAAPITARDEGGFGSGHSIKRWIQTIRFVNEGVMDLITPYVIVSYTEIINIKKSNLPLFYRSFDCFFISLLKVV